MWISDFCTFLNRPCLRCCCGRDSIISQCAFYRAISKNALSGCSFGWCNLITPLANDSIGLISCLIIDFEVLIVEWPGFVYRLRSWSVASGVSVFFIGPLISGLTSNDPDGLLVCTDCLEIAADAAESSHCLCSSGTMSMSSSGIVIPLTGIRGLNGHWFVIVPWFFIVKYSIKSDRRHSGVNVCWAVQGCID